MNKIKLNYRNIYIIDSNSFWDDKYFKYELEQDLVLTYDFALKKKIESMGGDIFYIDHLASPKVLHDNNFIMYEFLTRWYKDIDKNDIFEFKKVSYGFSFRLEFLNEFISYIRLYLSLKELKNIKYKELFIKTETNLINTILNDLDISFDTIEIINKNADYFYFPINKWLQEKLKPSGIRKITNNIKNYTILFFGGVKLIIDKILRTNNKIVFIHKYHPTYKIIRELNKDKKINVLLISFLRNVKFVENLKLRFLPIYGSANKYISMVNETKIKFREKRINQLILADGSDITTQIYRIIEKNIFKSLDERLNVLDCCISYIENNNVKLEILIANIGTTEMLFDMVCRYKKIPSYLIVNGLIPVEYGDEAKHATTINAYSENMKNTYFKNMSNTIVLGDPRMDLYSQYSKSKFINREMPTITIGASGFFSNSLHGYLAMEFDFMFSVLSGLEQIIKNNVSININIKVRSNGYLEQYMDFVNKFFPNIKIDIHDNISMKEILEKTDLYISIHSQTLFEASCMGIPVIYYKSDTEEFLAPFDGNSELVMVSSIDGLVDAFYDFKDNHDRFKAFLNQKNMEKYVGPLDGRNLKRNLDFIYKILE